MPMDNAIWKDISDEKAREYIYPSGFTLRVDKPDQIHISVSSLGGHAHRIKTADGLAFYVAPGWVAIRWQVKPGAPLFQF